MKEKLEKLVSIEKEETVEEDKENELKSIVALV